MTFCPISADQIDHCAGRVTALAVSILLIVGLCTNLAAVALPLACDFLLRACNQFRFSPLAAAATWLCRRLELTPQPVNAGPKRFAARLGSVMTIAIAALALAGLSLPAGLLAGMLALFAALEGCFSFCAACLIYPYLFRAPSDQGSVG
jgi:hypothetical protein